CFGDQRDLTMVQARSAHWRLYAGLAAAAVLSFAAVSIPFRLAANDSSVDPVTTGAIAPVPAVRPGASLPPAAAPQPMRQVAALEPVTVAKPAPPPTGSEAFLAALAQIEDGQEVEAFAAARDLTDAVERRTIEWASFHYGGRDLAYADLEMFKA